MLYLILKSCGKVPSSWLHTCWTHGTSMIWAFPFLLLSMFLWTQFYSYKCLQGESERCCNATKPSLFSCKNLWILFVVSTQFWFQLPPPGKISRKERCERVFWRLIQDYLHNKEEKEIISAAENLLLKMLRGVEQNQSTLLSTSFYSVVSFAWLTWINLVRRYWLLAKKSS